jgi:hypothetical protein
MPPVSGVVARRVAKGRLAVEPLPLSGHADLSRLAASYDFFTPGALFLRGRLTDDVLHDFACRHGGDVRLFGRNFAKPVFSGLVTREGDRVWDHTLWAAPAGLWPDLREFLLGVKVTDTARRRLWGVGLQDLVVLDPAFVDRSAVLPQEVPLLRVTAFGVNGNAAAWAFAADAARPWATPALVRHPPLPATVRFAEAVFRERDPYAATEPDPYAAAAAGGPGLSGPVRLGPADAVDPAARERLLREWDALGGRARPALGPRPPAC